MFGLSFKLSLIPESPSITVAVAVRRLTRELVDARGMLHERETCADSCRIWAPSLNP